MSNLAVEAETLSKSYRRHQALRSITFAIRPGDVVALLGPNGAGKTTLARIVTGGMAPDSGVIRIFGFNPQRSSSRKRLGVMLQKSGLPDNLTVRELIELQSSYYPCPLPFSKVEILAGLRGLLNKTPRKLSGGQVRRVCYAMAICGSPDLLVLDEPTTGMDAESRALVWGNIEVEAARGTAVLLTTHMLEEVDAVANRVILLNEGEVIAAASSAELKTLVGRNLITCTTELRFNVVDRIPGHKGIKLDGGTLDVFVEEPVGAVRFLLEADPCLSNLQVRKSSLQDVLDIIGNGLETNNVSAGGVMVGAKSDF